MRRLSFALSLVLLASSAAAIEWGPVVPVSGITWMVLGNYPAVDLWRTNGTRAGTFPVRINGRLASRGAVLNGRTYFLVQEDVRASLYESDGTQAGTRQVVDLGPIVPAELVSTGRKLFFVSRNWYPDGVRLWTSDGTSAGTSVLLRFITEELRQLRPAANGVLFSCRTFDKSYVLWRSDGTVEGTVRLNARSPMGSANGLAFFAEGAQVYGTDGTAAGTVLLPIPDATRIIVGGGDATYTVYGRTLWRTDGTTAGTRPLRTFDFAPGAIVPFGSRVFVVEERRRSVRVWAGGGDEELRVVAELPARAIAPSDDRSVSAAMAGRELWLVVPGGDRRTLWRVDTDSYATSRGPDLPPTMTITGTWERGLLLELRYGGTQPWATDGTIPGTVMLLSDSSDLPVVLQEERGTIRGRLVDAATGSLITYPLEVRAIRNDGYTVLDHGEDGRYELTVPAGQWRIQVKPPDYYQHPIGKVYTTTWYPDLYCDYRCDSDHAPRIPVTPGSVTEDQDIRFRSTGGRVEGHVVDAANGAPIAVGVYLWSEQGSLYNGEVRVEEGTFLIPYVKPGSYYLVAESQSYARHVWDEAGGRVCREGSCGAPSITIGEKGVITGLNLRLRRGALLDVRLIDAETRQPLPRHPVVIRGNEGPSRHYSTGQAGTVRTDVWPGAVTLSVPASSGWREEIATTYATEFGDLVQKEIVVHPLCTTRLFPSSTALPPAGGKVTIVAQSQCEVCVRAIQFGELTNACGGGTRNVTLSVPANLGYEQRSLLLVAPGVRLTLTQEPRP